MLSSKLLAFNKLKASIKTLIIFFIYSPFYFLKLYPTK
ncbi:hypothetical protein CJH_07335 [Campylobacter jejuni subsp. jejuni F38011]|nr:hypothetical protein CJH_07335 [Campylobacter jejuni subsp. jejuni F38011]